MKKIIEMKTDVFLKKIKNYALKKVEGRPPKESPLKLYTTPHALVAVKVKFMFAKTHEIALKPDGLLFFKKSLARTVKAKITDADSSKTYYFGYFTPLLQELTNARIYVGKNISEKLENLAAYLSGVKDGKVIFEIIYGDGLNVTDAIVKENGEESIYSTSIIESGESITEVSESITENLQPEGLESMPEAELVPHTGLTQSVQEDLIAARATAEEYKILGKEEKLEQQASIIRDFQDKVAFYEKLAREGGLEIKGSKKRLAEQEIAIKGLESKIELYQKQARQSNLEAAQDKKSLGEQNLVIKRLEDKVRFYENQARQDSLEIRASKKGIEEQEFIIKGLGDKITLYEKLARESDLKIKKGKTKLKENKKQLKENKVQIEAGSLEIEKIRKIAEETEVKMAQSDLEITSLKEAMGHLKAENEELKALHTARNEGIPKKEEDREIPEGAKADNRTEAREEGEGQDGEEDYDFDELGDLIDEVNRDPELDKSVYMSAAITEWNDMLRSSRYDPVTIPLYNKDKKRDENRAVPRFKAISRLMEEQAAHFAGSSGKEPWPKQAKLAKLQSDSYGFDLKCFSLYQGFDKFYQEGGKDLRKFLILFVFWEMASHNRFYRSALKAVLNGGKTPDALGMAGTDPTDTMLRLLHYADLTRILMGHYHYIARHQFDIGLFTTQDENKARFGSTRETGMPGKDIDIRRSAAETHFYI